MDKQTYINELAALIGKLPKDAQLDILADYGEHFDIARSHGRSDEEIAKRLGTPQKVAKEILVQHQITNAQANPSFNNVWRAVIAAVGLGLLNLIFVLAPFMVGLLIPVILGIVGAVLLLSPVLLLIQDGFTMTYVKELFMIAGLVGFGLLLLVGAAKSASFLYTVTLRYLKYNLSIVKGAGQ